MPVTWNDSCDGSTVIAAAWGCCFAAAWVTNSAGAFYFDDIVNLQDLPVRLGQESFGSLWLG